MAQEKGSSEAAYNDSAFLYLLFTIQIFGILGGTYSLYKKFKRKTSMKNLIVHSAWIAFTVLLRETLLRALS